AKASSVGANTVKGPSPRSVSSRPAACTAAISVAKPPAEIAVSTTSHTGAAASVSIGASDAIVASLDIGASVATGASLVAGAVGQADRRGVSDVNGDGRAVDRRNGLAVETGAITGHHGTGHDVIGQYARQVTRGSGTQCADAALFQCREGVVGRREHGEGT